MAPRLQHPGHWRRPLHDPRRPRRYCHRRRPHHALRQVPGGTPPMKALSLDRYIARESAIHAADARIKFVLVVASILSVSLLPIGSFVALALASGVLVLLSSIAGLGPLPLD